MPKSHEHRNKNDDKGHLVMMLVAAAVILVGIVALGFSGIVPGFRLAIGGLQPGFEGLNVNIYGFAQGTNTAVTPLGTNLTAPFSWSSVSPYSASVSVYDPTVANPPFLGNNNEFNMQKGQVGVQTSITSTDTDHPIEEISYYLYNGTSNGVSTYTHVVGELVSAYVNVNIWSANGHGDYLFNGQQIWLVAQTNVWNRAIIDPTNPSATAFAANSIPIAAVIQSYTINNYVTGSGTVIQTIPSWVQANAQISPENQGGVLQFYTQPTTSGVSTVTYLNPIQISADELNASVAGSLNPDSRFAPVVYTPITLTSFGGSYSGSGNYLGYLAGAYQFGYPSVTLKIQVYYLVMGSFLLQVDNKINSTLPIPVSTNSTVTSTWYQDLGASLNSWFSSPLVEIGAFLTILAIGIVALVIFLVFTGVGQAVDKAAGSAMKSHSKNNKNHNGGK